jgi:hypothetical protein
MPTRSTFLVPPSRHALLPALACYLLTHLYDLPLPSHYWFPMWPTFPPFVSLYSWLFSTGTQSAATCTRWFLAREFFYPEDGSDAFIRNVGSHKKYTGPHPRKRHSTSTLLNIHHLKRIIHVLVIHLNFSHVLFHYCMLSDSEEVDEVAKFSWNFV